MDNDLLDRIRERAFALWEGEGKPEGRHEEHWRQASAELDTPPAPTAPSASAKPREAAAQTAASPEAAKRRPTAKAAPTARGTAPVPARKPRSRKAGAPDA